MKATGKLKKASVLQLELLESFHLKATFSLHSR